MLNVPSAEKSLNISKMIGEADENYGLGILRRATHKANLPALWTN